MNLKGKKTKNQVVTANIFEQQELLKKAEVIREKLTASTWHELETNGNLLHHTDNDPRGLAVRGGHSCHALSDPASAYANRHRCATGVADVWFACGV